ncbi:MAG: D-tyrosyl-tRNA(Tyr) deacylase [Erysipelotrichaceae bacterium]|nr:D-tyrosyl-tRNA(Tyr) deacylase [Erysipelotrichaceae bacterium]
MKIVVQRTTGASVVINQKIVGKINQGLVALVGFEQTDTKAVVDKMVDKMIGLRIFSDENDKMNLSLKDIGGEILSISQFTLYADCKKGRRPSFINAAKPDYATTLYDYFNEKISSYHIPLALGQFGADMKVSLVNDGPVTIILDSKELL